LLFFKDALICSSGQKVFALTFKKTHNLETVENRVNYLKDNSIGSNETTQRSFKNYRIRICFHCFDIDGEYDR
jgi:hypothetical protein